MANIFDVYGDSSLRGLTSILKDNPEHYDSVRGAQIGTEDRDTLPESAFAYPEEKRYPINSKEMAMLSSLYRNYFKPEDQGMQVPPYVDENLEKAAYLYDFEVPKQILKKTAAVIGYSKEDYLLPEEKKFPVTNIKEASMVQDIIVNSSNLMGYNHLAQACSRLITKMAEYKVDVKDINPIIYKYAGLTKSNKDILDASIEARSHYSKNEYKESYDKLATLVQGMDYNRDNLVKIAATLEYVDAKAGLRNLYDKKILNPIDSVFNTNKLVREKSASYDAMFTPEHAERVTPDQIGNLLGGDVLDEIGQHEGNIDKERMLQVINSLPTDMVRDFVERI